MNELIVKSMKLSEKVSLNKKPFISIGLPVYNAEEKIEKRLKSIFNQTYQNFELVISNNSSSDNTQKICQKLAKSDNRIRLFCQEKNIGSMKNFFFVLDNAKHEFFVWTSDSDIWEPTFLEKNLNMLLKNENLVGCMCKIKRYGNQVNERDISSVYLIKKIVEKFAANPDGTI